MQARNAQGGARLRVLNSGLHRQRSSAFPSHSLKAEQEAIAAILSDMDAEIAALEEKLTKARQIKQGMMQELLTGKTRLVDNGKWKMESEK